MTTKTSICCLVTLALVTSWWVCGSFAPAQEQTTGKYDELFTKEGAPVGWLVRQWDDVSKPAAAWMIKNGELHGGEPRGSWLMSKKAYEDFNLEFEFKLGPKGNSGLALRAPLKGDPAFDGLELQMADLRYNPEAKDSELTGGIYRAVAPLKQVYKPEAWNRYEITLKGPKLRVVLNGELIQDLDLSKQNRAVARHDGSAAPSIKLRPRRGHVGFQELSRGEEHVRIRNARLKVLL